jgi:hypothetical protein
MGQLEAELAGQGQSIQGIIQYLEELQSKPEQPRLPIGFRR